MKDKYAQALALLRALPGTNSSLDQQENAIAEAKEELKRIRYDFPWLSEWPRPFVLIAS